MSEDVYLKKPWLKNYDKNVQAQLTYDDKTFVEKFSEAVQVYPDKTAIIYLGRKFTFKELDLLSNQLAHYIIRGVVG